MSRLFVAMAFGLSYAIHGLLILFLGAFVTPILVLGVAYGRLRGYGDDE